jgi:diguanylate cyclase (GGDEF)-like protein
VLADLDDFKRVNDAYGHEAGDRVLVAFASRLRESVRESDLVARLGGEEFALVLPEIDLDGALAMAERVRRRLTDEPIGAAGAVTLLVTASFGVAEASAAPDWSALLRRADAALYAAKGAGKNRVSGTPARDRQPAAGLPARGARS